MVDLKAMAILLVDLNEVSFFFFSAALSLQTSKNNLKPLKSIYMTS